MILFGQYTAKERKEALIDAESRLDLKGHTPMVELQVKQLKTMPVLFQPRERLDQRTTDEEHVKSLKRAVDIYGGIEAPMVIKLKGTGFVIGDGHSTTAQQIDSLGSAAVDRISRTQEADMRGIEPDDSEMAYRRGYQAGAVETFHVVEQFLDPATRESLRAWIDAAGTSRTSSSSVEPIVHAPISRQMHGRHGISPLIELG
jgi:hypothetical protein